MAGGFVCSLLSDWNTNEVNQIVHRPHDRTIKTFAKLTVSQCSATSRHAGSSAAKSSACQGSATLASLWGRLSPSISSAARNAAGSDCSCLRFKFHFDRPWITLSAMPRFSLKTLFVVFLVVAVWLSTIIGYPGTGTVRTEICLLGLASCLLKAYVSDGRQIKRERERAESHSVIER
jgi:hypothetical protein